MKKLKKRTAAERSAAAKKAWARRKAAKKTQTPKVTASSDARVVREGSEIFVTFSYEGSLFRHRISPSTVKALMLDAVGLVHA